MGPLCETETQPQQPKEEKSGFSHATQDKNAVDTPDFVQVCPTNVTDVTDL